MERLDFDRRIRELTTLRRSRSRAAASELEKVLGRLADITEGVAPTSPGPSPTFGGPQAARYKVRR